jgi:hypothetical protein
MELDKKLILHAFFDAIYLVICLVYTKTLMGYPTKVQLIQRKNSQQWYINFPAPIAQAMDFSKGEEVQWTIVDKTHLVLSRNATPPHTVALKNAIPSPIKAKH